MTRDEIEVASEILSHLSSEMEFGELILSVSVHTEHGPAIARYSWEQACKGRIFRSFYDLIVHDVSLMNRPLPEIAADIAVSLKRHGTNFVSANEGQ